MIVADLLPVKSKLPEMPSHDLFRRYASDFTAFCDDAMIPTALGSIRFGDVMADFQRAFIADLAPSLLAVATGKMPSKPKFWAEMTKGCGKDLILALAVIWLLIFARRSVRIQLGAADQDQAAETHHSIVGILLCWEWLKELIDTPNYRVVCKTTNGEAEILAADIAGSHGAVGVDVLILNELHAVTKWEFIENLADNSSKNKACVTICATNAGFKNHPAWKWRELARTSDRWSFHQVCEPAPWTSKAEIEEARLRSTLARFMRLWYGVWSGTGDALDEADIEAAIDRSSGPILGKLPGVGFVGGLDLGIKSDHSGFVVVGKQQLAGSEPTYRLASCQTWAPSRVTGKVDLEAVKQAIVTANATYGLQAVAYDPWQAEFMAEQLRKEFRLTMIEVPFVGKNLDSLARNLLEVFRNRVFTMFDCPRLLADLRKLTIVERPNNSYRITATRDATGHADAATATLLALLCARDHCRAGSMSWGGVNLNTSQFSPRTLWTSGITPAGGHKPGIHWDRAT